MSPTDVNRRAFITTLAKGLPKCSIANVLNIPFTFPTSVYIAKDKSIDYIGEIVLVDVKSANGRSVAIDIITDDIGKEILTRITFQRENFVLQTKQGKTICVSEACVTPKYQQTLSCKHTGIWEMGFIFEVLGKAMEL